MTITNQYKPISNIETATDDGLTGRFCQDMADNLNNFAMYVGSHKLIGQVCVPEWRSHASTTEERVIWRSGPRRVPDGFTHGLVISHHYRISGSDSTIWKLYCAGWVYAGPALMDKTWLFPGYTTYTWTTSSGDLARDAAEEDSSLELVRGPTGLTCFALTAANGDAATQSALTSLDVWPATGITQTAWGDWE